MSTRTRKRPDPDPAQLAAMAAAREITRYLWSLRDERGRDIGVGTIDMSAETLSTHLVVPIRRALRTRRKGAKR